VARSCGCCSPHRTIKPSGTPSVAPNQTPNTPAYTPPPSRVVIKLPRHDYEEIIDALEGGEDAGAESDAGEDYDLAG